MNFKLKAVGFKDLDRNLKALARQISPQVGVASALEEGADIIALEAQHNAREQKLIDKGDLIASIVPVKINQYRVDVIVRVPYGAAHEFGVTVVITQRQRQFFWYMFISTGDPMWKALALSTKYTIPARPYLRPAIAERKKVAYRVIANAVRNQIKEKIR